MILPNADDRVQEFHADAPEPSAETLGYPPALAKACCDSPFDYAACLRGGSVIRFDTAEPINEEWVTLFIDEQKSWGIDSGMPFPFPRGVDVRVSEIVWVADAPEGS